jgi:prefoldin subunit 5
MTDESNAMVDPNTADEDTLARLPGVGPVMAQRILAARPFETLEDLKRVSGIGPVALARLQPHLALPSRAPQELEATVPPAEAGATPPPEAEEARIIEEESAPATALAAQEEPQQQPAEISAPLAGEAKVAGAPHDLQPEIPLTPPAAGVTVPAPPAEPTPVPTPVTAAPTGWITRGQAVLLAFVSGFFALMLALILSLGILAALNNGQLQFATPAQVNRLAVQLNGLDDRASSLEGDLQNLRIRIANLEPLGQRVDAVEASAQKLGTDLEAISGQVDTLNGQVKDLGGQVEALQAQSNRFQGFVDGLRTLLNNLFAPGGEGK